MLTASILIPVFNHEDFLPDLFKSLSINCNDSHEILFCDDNSGDTSYNVCRELLPQLKKKCAHVYLTKNNHNLGVVRNLDKLIREARADILVPIASDDFFLANGLDLRIESLLADPNKKLAFCDGQGVDMQGRVIVPSLAAAGGFLPVDFSGDKIAQTFALKWNPPLNLQSWRRNFFKVHGGEFEFDSSVFCEDLPYALAAGASGNVGFASRPCVAYRCRSWPQISQGKKEALWKDMGYLFGKYAFHYEKSDRTILRMAGERFYLLSIGDVAGAQSKWIEIQKFAEDCKSK